LVKGIMRSPKSYTLWFHRQWIIERGLKFERDMFISEQAATEKAPSWKSLILETELKLCDKMLL
jgi:hypothetical protein